MNYFLHGFGVFLGVLAGTAVTLLTQWIAKIRSEKQRVKNLRFEFELNIKKIERWLQEITHYRNAVNGDALNMYAGYFDLARFVTVTADKMFQAGLLYKYLNYQEIGDLQIIVSEFSLHGDQYLNNQIAQNKAYFDKQKAVSDVNFWEKKFKDHKKTMEDLLNKLPK